LVAELQAMDSDTFFEALIDAGIIDKEGNLTEKYKRTKKA
jgi:hypothetical protein